MPRALSWKIIEEEENPKVLIIGGKNLAPFLAQKLKEHGCQVFFSFSSKKEKFFYIFQFGDIQKDKALLDLLAPGGKFLYLDTNLKEELVNPPDFRVLRLGDLSLWPKEEVQEKILQAMFLEKKKLIDARKKMSFYPEKKPLSSFSSLRTQIPKQKKIFLEVEKKPHFFWPKKFLFFLFFILLFAFGASALLFSYYFSLQRTFLALKKSFAAADFLAVEKNLQEARGKISLAKNFFSYFPFTEEIVGLLGSTEKALKTSEDILSFPTSFSKKNFGALKETGFSSGDLEFLKAQTFSLQNSLLQTLKRVEKINLPYFPRDDLIFLLKDVNEKLEKTKEFLPLFEDFFLKKTPKIYLVLFQNNMELRPTGGFIGSFGLLTLEKEGIFNLKIEDVYTADGQLKGHVEPPAPIRKYLNQPHFYLRDSNFDPDFAHSALQANFFLKKELGFEVDGVIGLNLFVVQRILSVLGPLKIADFGNELISSDNFFSKAHDYAQKDFFPGSTQKKDFLTAVSNTLLTRLNYLSSREFFSLLPLVKQLLDEKNILLFSFDDQVQSKIEEKGWGGRVAEIHCLQQKENCFPDYLLAIEANLGVNKANYFVNKSIVVEKKISPEKIFSAVTLAYENQAPFEIYPDSFYGNYLRFFLPKAARLLRMTLNNVEIPPGEIDKENYGEDKVSFGSFVRIAPGNKGKVKIEYELPFSQEFRAYEFFYQKQGGDKTSPLVLSFRFPQDSFWQPNNFSAQTAKEEEIYYATDTSVDRIFIFEKKSSN